MQETLVRSLGWEDPLEKGKASSSSILAWEIPWIEAPGGLQLMGLQRLGCDLVTENNISISSPRLCTIFLNTYWVPDTVLKTSCESINPQNNLTK